nr:MAG TPA: hypothetical protein [Caudoviricetes sp.]
MLIRFGEALSFLSCVAGDGGVACNFFSAFAWIGLVFALVGRRFGVPKNWLAFVKPYPCHVQGKGVGYSIASGSGRVGSGRGDLYYYLHVLYWNRDFGKLLPVVVGCSF